MSVPKNYPGKYMCDSRALIVALNTNVAAAFSFSREAILQFKQNRTDAENPNRGTLIFTGATASMRGNTMTSAFAIGKFGARALSQSLSKEFGKDDIHVCQFILRYGVDLYPI